MCSLAAIICRNYSCATQNRIICCSVIIAAIKACTTSRIYYFVIPAIGTSLVLLCFTRYPRVIIACMGTINLTYVSAIYAGGYLLISFGVIGYLGIFMGTSACFKNDSALYTFLFKQTFYIFRRNKVLCRGMFKLVGNLYSTKRANLFTVIVRSCVFVLTRSHSQ